MNVSDRLADSDPAPVSPADGPTGRARAEAAEQVVSAYERVAEGLMILDRDWRYTYINAPAEQMLGWPPEKLLGASLWDAFPFVLGPEGEGRLRGVAADRVSCDFIGHDRFTDRWYEGRAAPLDDGGVALYFRDVTDQRRVEDALRRSEERFRRYFDLGLIGMALTAPDKGVLEVNDEICRILGYTREELLRMTWADLTHPDDLAADIALFNRVMAGEIDGYVLDKQWIRKDGRAIDGTISVKCVRNDSGTVEYFVALLEDVTDRKRAEAERERLALLVEHSTDFIGLCDRDGNPFFANPAALRLVGLESIDQVRRTTVKDYFFPEDQPFVMEEYMPQLIREGRAKTEIRFRHFTTGEAIWMVFSSFVVNDPHGKLVGLATVSRDVTEERRARDELEARVAERTAELARANEALRTEARKRSQAQAARIYLLRLLATAQEDVQRRVARDLHDQVGQQLTALTLGLQAARDGGADPAALEQLQRAAEEMARGLHDVALRLRPTALDDIGLSAALRSGVEEWVRGTGVEVNLDTDALRAERLPAEVETALYRVAQEAVHNALKHARPRRINVLVEHRNHHVTAIVEDDGVGFDADAVLSRPPSGRLGILGMGERLALVGGSLDVESSAGAGTTVYARVPLPPASKGGSP